MWGRSIPSGGKCQTHANAVVYYGNGYTCRFVLRFVKNVAHAFVMNYLCFVHDLACFEKISLIIVLYLTKYRRKTKPC